jgi:hypothetical protein
VRNTCGDDFGFLESGEVSNEKRMDWRGVYCALTAWTSFELWVFRGCWSEGRPSEVPKKCSRHARPTEAWKCILDAVWDLAIVQWLTEALKAAFVKASVSIESSWRCEVEGVVVAYCVASYCDLCRHPADHHHRHQLGNHDGWTSPQFLLDAS